MIDIYVIFVKKNIIMAINIEDIKKNRKVLASFDYEVAPSIRGYTDKILYVNVGSVEIKSKDVPAQMKEKFI